MKSILFLSIVFSFFIYSCKPKIAPKKEQEWEYISPGRQADFGDFRIMLIAYSVRNSLGYYGRAEGLNKYVVLNLSYTNISNTSKNLRADGILALYNEKTCLFDENRILSGGGDLTLNPGVTESIELAYKVPISLNGSLDFVPDLNTKKAIQFDINGIMVRD